LALLTTGLTARGVMEHGKSGELQRVRELAAAGARKLAESVDALHSSTAPADKRCDQC